MKKKSIAMIVAAAVFAGALAHAITSTGFGRSATVQPVPDAVSAATESVETDPAAEQRQLKVSILGDSYSTFKGYVTPEENLCWYRTEKPRNDVNDVKQTWWQLFIDRHGYTLELNNSYSGATICHTGYGRNDYSDRSFVTRVDNLGQPDIIFFFGGTNDDWADSPLGDYQYEGWTKKDLYNVRPAIAKVISDVRRIYPQAQLYVLLNSELKESTNESFATICAKMDADLIVLHDIEKQDLHPSQKGMIAIADQIDAFITQKQKR